MVAVVPLRDGVSGKSRLAAALTPDERRRLVAALARHVVGTLRESDGVGWVLVVTADVAFVEEVLAGLGGPGPAGGAHEGHGEHGVRPASLEVLAQPADRPGLNAALDVAREHVRATSPDAVLLVAHADLPAITPGDVTALLGAAREADVVVATDRHGTGTNLLALPAGAAYDFRFGAGSRGAHEAEAARRGLRAVVVQHPGTAADLDTIDDWDQLPAAARARLAG
ncbi:2-phospho-L-lactate guanylyltransferase [Xylanimonas oleitrophica]|uniref:Phosphoenolpyruvate guanylyltransferase n=1 Tax=Xylanimonas oleitrophica TaxID=2607479 RepID=A0A2W5WJI2_9MICO|nr:2-phospho-L-lactate guanylyltransferase [Xylanimonas oleitrophica]